MSVRNRSLLAIAFIILSTSACGRKSSEKEGAVHEPLMPVRLQHPGKIQRPAIVAASGTVEAMQTADIGFLIAGRVIRVLVEEGQVVRKGEVIAEIDPVDYRYGLQASEGQAGVAKAALEKAQTGSRPEELEQAKAAYEKADNEYRRYRELYERKSLASVDFAKVEAAYRVAKAQYEMAQNGARKEDREAAGAAVRQAEAQVNVSRKRISDTRLASPLSGIVARRSIDPGEIAGAGVPVFSIVSLNPARVRVGVPEADIGQIHTGGKAAISIPALGGIEFRGTVELVGVAADPASRTFTAKLLVPNPKLILKAGMIAETGIETGGIVQSIVIPGEAVVHDPQGSTLVYVYYPDRRRVYARRVETGAVRDRGIEITSGLSETDLIVTAGQHQVREGSLVEVMP